jgi:hypothetical protein
MLRWSLKSMPQVSSEYARQIHELPPNQRKMSCYRCTIDCAVHHLFNGPVNGQPIGIEPSRQITQAKPSRHPENDIQMLGSPAWLCARTQDSCLLPGYYYPRPQSKVPTLF